MDQRLLYTEQVMTEEERELVISNHLHYLLSNFNHISRGKIKEDLEGMYDLISRYS